MQSGGNVAPFVQLRDSFLQPVEQALDRRARLVHFEPLVEVPEHLGRWKCLGHLLDNLSRPPRAQGLA